jgi:hypothetical protein
VSGDNAAPRIRLRMGSTKTPEPLPQKLTLRLPGKAGDPSSSMEMLQSGVTVDSEALKRQQELVRAGSNGLEVPRNSTPPARNLRDRSGSGTRCISAMSRRSQDQEIQGSTFGASPVPSTSAIKSEILAGQSPSLTALHSNHDSYDSSKHSNESPFAVSLESSAGLNTFPPPNATPAPNCVSLRSSLTQTYNLSSHNMSVHVVSPLDSRLRKPGKGNILPDRSGFLWIRVTYLAYISH